MQPTTIAPFYYLDNFLCALQWVQERYADLLDDAERDFIRRFQSTARPSQALLVRMIMRKGEHFRASKLQYAEIGNPCQAVSTLIEAGWVRDDAPLQLAELFALLRKDEIHQRFAPPVRGMSKGALLEQLQADQPAARGFGQWCPALADPLYSLTISPLCERLRLLFFGNLEQTWSEFVLTDLGIFRYEQVAILPQSRGFRSRRELDQYQHLRACRDAFDAGMPIIDILAQLGEFRSDNPHLASRHGRLLLKLARQLERDDQLAAAAELYRRCEYPGARQRHIRVLEKQADYLGAHTLACAAAQAPESDSEMQLVERALQRLTRKMGQAGRRRKPEPAAGRFELLLTPAAGSVEQQVREHLQSPDAPVHYVENSLINSLFGLLCWDAIFAPVPGAFFHPFQNGPADLHEAHFRSRRAELFDGCFAQLSSGAYRDVIRRTWQAKYGIQSPFVFWGMLSQTLLEQALRCLPAAHLQIWFERLLADIRANRTGMPDLIQFWPEEQRYRMIEVKGPGDRLQDNQRRWLALCAEHGMPVNVCYVQWAST